MVTSADDRRRTRTQQATQHFGAGSGAALDAMALLDWAWHDCYGETSPPDDVLDDVWLIADGDLGRLVSAAHLAVLDFRDLRTGADALRRGPG